MEKNLKRSRFYSLKCLVLQTIRQYSILHVNRQQIILDDIENASY